MTETIMIIGTLVVVLLMWSRIGTSLDWTGNKFTKIDKPLDSGLDSFDHTMLRAKIITYDSLQDEILDSQIKADKRAEKRVKSQAGRSKAATAAATNHNKWLDNINKGL